MNLVETEYLTIIQTGTSASGKTLVFEVRNREHRYALGDVKWHSQWRQYVFVPRAAVCPIFSAGCLSDIAAFVEQATEAHRARRQSGREVAS